MVVSEWHLLSYFCYGRSGARKRGEVVGIELGRETLWGSPEF